MAFAYIYIHLYTRQSYCANSNLNSFKHSLFTSLPNIVTKKNMRWWIRNYVLCHYVMCSLLAIALQVILWWWHNCECLRVIFYYLIVRVCVSRRSEDRIHIGDSIVILRDFPYINSLPDIVYLTLNNELLNKNT